MTRTFYQTHECGGYRAKVTIEWASPEGKDMDELDHSRMTAAEEVAAYLLTVIGPQAYAIVNAMRGRTRTTTHNGTQGG